MTASCKISLVAALLLARPLAAQTFRGTVRDSATHQPVVGAVFMVLDSAGVVLARRMTDERGSYQVAVAGNARWVRAVRIGFFPREIRVSIAGGDRSLDFAMLPVPTMLSAVTVRDESSCPRRSDRAAALGLWEQARAGLLATVVAQESNPANVRLLEFEREMGSHDEEVTRLTVSADSATGTAKSFDSAHSARDFVRLGFSTDSGGTRLLFGPDAAVLLDDSFATAYCFQLAAPVRSRPNQVGLAFAAANHPRGRVDIDGTLWVDTAARALREIEYRYRGLPGNTDAFHPGGQISFYQSANGSVMIDRWSIRSTSAVREVHMMSGKVFETARLIPHEAGGELASAVWPDGKTWHASLGTLRIHAERHGKAVANYEIALPGTHYRATTDANGDAEIPELIPGPYTVEVIEPRLAALDIRIATPVKFVAVRDSIHRATIQISSVEEWAMQQAPRSIQLKKCDSMFVFGRVVTVAEKPVDGAKVTFAVLKPTNVWDALEGYFTTDDSGLFMSCGSKYSIGGTVRVRVQRSGQLPVDMTRVLGDKITVLKVIVPAAP
jgi:hypothetical protein